MSPDSQPKTSKEQHLLPVSLYLGIFFLLLIMTFVNIGISKLPIPAFWMTTLLILVPAVQVILVAVFFMELIHEDKFYSFIFVSAILFISLFILISLVEIRIRDIVVPIEGVKVMRQIDQNGNFSPGSPKLDKKE